ncbi:MAG: hypothetical protein CVV42_11750 [Candidatus Riflebacteria bacterium HGW-Riflebacteria-2]|jgi:tetratricopeptide (TPR) repeat protein|nr:MAG: hypothetical protein CVV42_11750 [Candidatus Riflebacteria bacterium HGW-Riflebacteria-2]
MGLLKKITLAILLLIVLPVLLLGLAELACHAVGIGYPTSLFIKDSMPDGTPCLRINYQAARRFFPGNLARRPLPEIMPAVKPAKRLRIFVLGESAARGEKLADFSFARMLEAALNKGSSEQVAEVINTGIPAINSWVLREFCREIVNYQPDALVIYAGHNEFIGPYGPASVFGLAKNRNAALTGIWASSLRIIQALKSDRMPTELTKGWQGLEMFLKNSIPADSPFVKECLANWQANMSDICKLAQERGIPVVWCQVPVNHKDCPPFMSDTRGLNQADLDKIKTFGEKVSEGDTSTAAQLAKELENTAKNNALYNYLAALLNNGTGDRKLARELFKKAVDLDCFRVRTTDAFNIAAQKIAQSYGAETVLLANLFAEKSAEQTTGKNLIYDHVHLTFRGHYLVARSVYWAMVETPLKNKLPPGFSFPDEKEMLELLGYSNADAIANLEHIISSMSRPPFTLQYNHARQLADLAKELAELQQRSDQVSATAVSRVALDRQPYNHRSAARLAMRLNDQPQAATNLFEQSLKLNPFNIDTLNNLASLQIQQNQLAEAETLLKRALDLAPGFAQAYFNLGLIAAARKDTTLAAAHYKTAAAADPAMFLALRNLGNLHFRNREFAQAKSTYEMAAAAAPEDMPSQLGIGNCLMEMQEPTMAVEMYKRAAEAFADSPLPRYSLGKALESSGKPAEAARPYEEAAKLGHLPSLQQLINLQLSEKITLNSEHFAKLCLLGCEMTDFKDPWFNQTLAISHAQRGELDEALGILHRAAALAQEQGKNELLREIEANIELITTSR